MNKSKYIWYTVFNHIHRTIGPSGPSNDILLRPHSLVAGTSAYDVSLPNITVIKPTSGPHLWPMTKRALCPLPVTPLVWFRS